MKLLLLLAVFVAAVAADEVTDELEKNGLPVGLLPSSISTYSIDKDGQFALSLKAPCYAKIDDQVWINNPSINCALGEGNDACRWGISHFWLVKTRTKCTCWSL